MPPRPPWKGFLKLSLVSCPIALYPAISPAERIAFRQVNRQTGNRLRHQLVDSVTGEVVQSHDKGRGYEIGQNQFLMVRDEELAAAQEEARSRPYSSAPAANIPQRTELEEPARASRMRREQPAQVEDEAPPEVTSPPAREPPPRIENNRTIELDRFFGRDQLDPRYYN